MPHTAPRARGAATRLAASLGIISLVTASPVAAQAAAPPGGATITGVIRTEQGQPIRGAYVVLGPRLGAFADSVGNYAIRVAADALPTDTVRAYARRIGRAPSDTLLRLRPGITVVWNVTLLPDPSIAEQARARSARDSAGGLDSMAAGLATTDTSSAFTYERFGIELLRAAMDSSTADTNRVLSPSSAGQALNVAWRAAVDASAHAIGRALHAGALDATGLADRTRQFRTSVGTRRDLTLRMATALWVDTSETLQPAFAGWARDQFGATARRLALHSPEALPIINAWADSATAGRIGTVREEPFADSVKVVLADAIYLKSQWLEPFDSTLTADRPFTIARGEPVSVPTMERTDALAYRQGPGYRALRVPYRAGLTAMYLVLPDSGVSPRSILDSLAATGWPAPDPRTEQRSVRLRLPRIHVEQGTNLRPALSGLGLDILFDSARADFGGLLVPSPHRPPPCPPIAAGPRPPCSLVRLSDATQHVFLDVDEEGTEAAAVTVLAFEVMVTGAPPPPLDFIVDRPFLLAIRDERTGTMLFVGYVADPRR